MINPEGLLHTIIGFTEDPIFLPTLGMAFSAAIRAKIIKSAGGKCEEDGCNASQDTGWMITASHLNHDKSSPLYNTPQMGEALCVPHHIDFHVEAVGNADEIGLTEWQNQGAIQLLSAMNPMMNWWLEQQDNPPDWNGY